MSNTPTVKIKTDLILIRFSWPYVYTWFVLEPNVCWENIGTLLYDWMEKSGKKKKKKENSLEGGGIFYLDNKIKGKGIRRGKIWRD